MTLPVFFTGSAALAEDRVVLSGSEGHHAATVRRLTVGESIQLVDGAGTRARCLVAEVGHDTVVCAVLDRRTDPPANPRLVVVQALPKGERGELAVELMTEAGVDAIVPWAAQRCVTKWKAERAAKSLGKWRATAVRAAKQARRSRTPEVAEAADTRMVAERLRGADLGVVLHEAADAALSGLELPAEGEVVVVVGPEGGITDGELDAFVDAGAVRALLGPTVLRTSTAGLAAAAVIQTKCGRW